jgi:hypothetical protein
MKYTYQYTDRFSPKLIEQHYLVFVSHHHYWFKYSSDMRAFLDSFEFDPRMRIAYPAEPSLDY